MSNISELKSEILSFPKGVFAPEIFRARGLSESKNTINANVRADGLYALFAMPEPHIYKNDLIAGSLRDVILEVPDDERGRAAAVFAKYPERTFSCNTDHYAADYFTAVEKGIPGMIRDIDASAEKHAGDAEATGFLKAMKRTLEGLLKRIENYAEKAESLKGAEGYDAEKLDFIAGNMRALLKGAPETFAQGLQLVWMIHNCFVLEGRYAMALGRIDRYLYPLYLKDIANGTLTDERCEELVANTFAKICEFRYRGCDDVVNICIGGVDEEGVCSVNGLSYCVLRAVRDVNLPGPNLSARITPDCPDEFLDECLKVIGTGLGYPALMNDTVNMAALLRKGYELKDVRNYCMVGCIENFITGMQPPWSDGRFDPINYLEAILVGKTAEELDSIESMDAFMRIYEERLKEGVENYIEWMRRGQFVAEPENMTAPFLSCFCQCCIERGRDINMGGAKYPSAHGAALMGIGTVSDSLAAIERVVFEDRKIPLSTLAAAIKANYEGYGDIRETVLAAPKYGNNDAFVDKYAVWYTSTLSDMFDRYTTLDGGPVYTAQAANVSNIYAGHGLGATPDGRLAGRPLSDAASPTYGCDVKGVTSTLLSVSKPDYTRCACGSVVNQKFSPSAFKDGKREKLAQLIRVYFSRGGQEIQINSTSREVLQDARIHPENYQSLVVRVSGFSALYVTLADEVQDDILSRTQHEEV
ncbi:MAG: hypothetical protein IKI41_09070 [Clostridia bacterium]|nr:hypothetical protein [Clostridia bacterium]